MVKSWITDRKRSSVTMLESNYGLREKDAITQPGHDISSGTAEARPARGMNRLRGRPNAESPLLLREPFGSWRFGQSANAVAR
jgi:hypothetical protein